MFLPAPDRVRLVAIALTLVTGCQAILDIDTDVPVLADTGGSTPCDLAQVGSDPQHCGACGHGCGGGDCQDGRCQAFVLARSSGTPTDIAVDDTHVYWSSADGTLHRIGKSGGAESVIVSGVGGGVARIALDGSRIYFRELRDAAGNSTIHGAGKDGSSPFIVASNQPGEGGIAASGGVVYWTRVDGTNIGSIVRAVIGNDGSVQLFDLTEQNLPFPGEIAVHGPFAYWGQSNDGELVQLAVDGSGSPLSLAACKDFLNALAADDESVYWTTESGDVTRTNAGDPANGCDAPSQRTIAKNPGNSPALGVALGGELVVWTSPDLGTVSAFPKSGTCSPPPCLRDLATGQPSPGRVAADSQAAYWINGGDGTISKVAF